MDSEQPTDGSRDASAASSPDEAAAADASATTDDGSDWRLRLRHFGEVILVMIGAYLFAGVSVSALTPALETLGVISADGNDARLARTTIQFLAIGVVSLWFADVVDTDRLIPYFIPNARILGVIAGGTVALLTTNIGVNQLITRLGFESGENVAITAGAGDPGYLLAMVVISVLLVGPAEELLFRGAIQGRLRESWGPWPAILGATVLFGVIHAPAVSGGTGAVIAYIVTAAILGVLLGYLYERTGNIVVPAAIHGANNAAVFGLLYLGEVGVV